MINSKLKQQFLDSVQDPEADTLLVDFTAQAMRDKLARKRKQGRGGWHTGACTNAGLLRLLQEHITKGDMLDVAIIASMMHCRRSIYGGNA